MWGAFATKLAVWMLKSAALDNQQRQLLTTCLLDRLGALPLRAKITVDEVHRVFIDGKPLTLETARLMHEGSRAMQNNFARRIVREQLTFMAVTKGVHENTSPEQGLFAKAALWVIQEENKLYDDFAITEGVQNA